MTKRFRIVAPALVALVVLLAGSAVMVRADNHDDVFYACLYAGSLTRVNNNGPLANCGRGVNVSWEGNDEVGFNYTVQRNGNSVVSSGLVAGPIVNSVAECEEDESATGGGWEITARSNVSTLDVHRSQGWTASMR